MQRPHREPTSHSQQSLGVAGPFDLGQTKNGHREWKNKEETRRDKIGHVGNSSAKRVEKKCAQHKMTLNPSGCVSLVGNVNFHHLVFQINV